MSEMKMSERFGSIPNFDIKEFFEDDQIFAIPNVQQCYDDINKAVNKHDRMVEEIAELKGLVDNLKKDRSSAISLMSKSWRHGAEDRPMILTSFVEMANRQFESLAKLNQEGEE